MIRLSDYLEQPSQIEESLPAEEKKKLEQAIAKKCGLKKKEVDE